MSFDEALHPRTPAGSSTGGQFARREGSSGEKRRRALREGLEPRPAGVVAGGVADSVGSPYWTRLDRHSRTLVIGDSHTWSSVYDDPDAYAGLDVDARPGRTSGGGIEMLERDLRGRHDVVVFDLATNDFSDPAALRRNLRKVARLVGDRRLVLVDSYRLAPDGSNASAAVSAVVHDFARRHSGTSVVRWAAAAQANPGWLGPDTVHYLPAGYAARAQLVEAAARRAARRGRVQKALVGETAVVSTLRSMVDRAVEYLP